jgi:aspartate-semialdehyde dehydrogenase
MDPEVPLVVPEVNPHHIAQYKNKGIIANPNCSTIQMVAALKPLQDLSPIRRIVVSTYQAVSGTGQTGIEELRSQLRDLHEGKQARSKVYPYQIAGNLLPHIASFGENGYTEEEMKMVYETRKILGDDGIMVSATCVRVPVEYSHSESVNVRFADKITLAQASEALKPRPGQAGG